MLGKSSFPSIWKMTNLDPVHKESTHHVKITDPLHNLWQNI